MKKIFIACLFASVSLVSVAQHDTTTTKQYHNEFGIDATSFIKQFFNFNQQQFQAYYTPVYYLSYRRFFRTGDIRAAIGGSFLNNQSVGNNYGNDSTIYTNKDYSLDVRIGWEFFNNLSKHWQVF